MPNATILALIMHAPNHLSVYDGLILRHSAVFTSAGSNGDGAGDDILFMGERDCFDKNSCFRPSSGDVLGRGGGECNFSASFGPEPKWKRGAREEREN